MDIRGSRKPGDAKLTDSAVQTAYVFAVLFFLVGCGESGPPMAKVTGKVTYPDGSAPKGATAVIRFEPTKDTNANIRKMASGQLDAEGNFEAFTVKPGDGVIKGKYKVTFEVLESYRTGVSLIDKKFTKIESTPFEVVVDGPSHEFDFEIEKANGESK